MSKVTCMAFLDNPLGRDTEILLPVTFVMERYFDIAVSFHFLWDMLAIRHKEPDIILLPNTRGHPVYVEIADFARAHSITVLALDSEGNFPTDGSFDYWGYNHKKIVYQDWITCWSQRTYDFTRSILPKKYRNRIVLTGGTAFDRYEFSDFSIPAIVRQKLQQRDYQLIIGYAGWAFGKLYTPQRSYAFNRLIKAGKSLEWAENQRTFVRDCLDHAIRTFPDILFILKKHPKENFEDEPLEGPNEMNELLNYPNVLYIKNESPVESLIYASQLWCGFETTTFFEAWLLDKPTIVINEDTDFPRTGHFQGAVLANTAEKLVTLIREYLTDRRLKDFETPEKNVIRKEMIDRSIGKTDGLNHLRAIYYFRHSFPQQHTPKRIRLNWRHLRLSFLMNWGRFFFFKPIFLRLPGFRKSIYVFENRGLPGLDERKQQVYREMTQFHQEKGLDALLRGNNWESLQSILKIE